MRGIGVETIAVETISVDIMNAGSIIEVSYSRCCYRTPALEKRNVKLVSGVVQPPLRQGISFSSHPFGCKQKVSDIPVLYSLVTHIILIQSYNIFGIIVTNCC